MNATDTIRSMLGTLGVNESPGGLILGERQPINGSAVINPAAGVSGVLIADQPISPSQLHADEAILLESVAGALTGSDGSGSVVATGASIFFCNAAGITAVFLFPAYQTGAGVIVTGAQTGFFAQVPPALRIRDMPGVNPGQALHLKSSVIVKNGTAGVVTVNLTMTGFYRIIGGVQP